VGTNKLLQCVQTQVSSIDRIRAARTNVGQQWVPTKLCNACERRLTMLTAYEQRVRM